MLGGRYFSDLTLAKVCIRGVVRMWIELVTIDFNFRFVCQHL